MMDSKIVGKSAKTKAHNGINQILNNVFKSCRSVFAKKVNLWNTRGHCVQTSLISSGHTIAIPILS